MKNFTIVSILLLLSSLILTAPVQAQERSGADTHGGAILRLQRDGRFLTFGQTDAFKVEVEPIAEILPEVVHLVNTVKGLSISDKVRSLVLEDIIPTTRRKYFRVAKISEDDTIRLLQNFRALSSDIPDDADPTIAGFTDPATRETYLLPVFFTSLEPASQDAILLHEALWSLKGRSVNLDNGHTTRNILTYDFVVRTEAMFERMLRCKEKCLESKYDFYSLFNEIPAYRVSSKFNDNYYGQGFNKRDAGALQTLRLLAEVESGTLLAKDLRESIFQQLLGSGKVNYSYSHRGRFFIATTSQSVFDLFVQNPKSATLSGFNDQNPTLDLKLTNPKDVFGSDYAKDIFVAKIEVWIGKDGAIELPPTWVLGNEADLETGFSTYSLPLIKNTKSCKKSGPSGKDCLVGWIN